MSQQNSCKMSIGVHLIDQVFAIRSCNYYLQKLYVEYTNFIMSLQRQVLLVDQNQKAHQWHKEQPTIQCVQIGICIHCESVAYSGTCQFQRHGSLNTLGTMIPNIDIKVTASKMCSYFGIGCIKDGFNHENVHTSIKQTESLVTISHNQIIKYYESKMDKYAAISALNHH